MTFHRLRVGLIPTFPLYTPPLILAKAKADSDVRRLEDLESAWARTRQHLKTKITGNTQSVARLTDDFEARVFFDNLPKSAAEHRVIVHDQ